MYDRMLFAVPRTSFVVLWLMAGALAIALAAVLPLTPASADHTFQDKRWSDVGWSEWAQGQSVKIQYIDGAPGVAIGAVQYAMDDLNATNSPIDFLDDSGHTSCYTYDQICIYYVGETGVIAEAWTLNGSFQLCNVCEYEYVDIKGQMYYPDLSGNDSWTWQRAIMAHELSHTASLDDHTPDTGQPGEELLMNNGIALVCSGCTDPRKKYAPNNYYYYDIYTLTTCEVQSVKWAYNQGNKC